jgi:hypothetical protein
VSSRLLISGGGTAASNNLIASLRAADPSLSIAACHSDRFVLKKSVADRRYLVPPASHRAWAQAIGRIIRSEKVDLLIPTSDGDVRALSDRRATIPCRLFLPRPATIARCQDKYALSRRLAACGVPSPVTHLVTNVDRLDELFRRLGRPSRAWCRLRTGSGAMGATPVTTPAQARHWIASWQAIRGIPTASFTLSEHLPGRDFGCQSLWKDGALVLIKTYERLSYLGMGSQPAAASSVAILSKTVVDLRVVDICTKAIRALDARASGVFSVDLKENAHEVPCITDVNAGRFSSATPIFDRVGKHNMAITYVLLALDEPVELRDEYDAVEDYYMLRDVDAPPAIFHADDFFHGIEEARRPRRVGKPGGPRPWERRR